MQGNHDRSGKMNGLNRRDFLKGTGAAVTTTALITSTKSSSAADPTTKPNVISGPTDIVLNVNGKDYQLKIEPRVTLLDALRNDLNLTGAKEVDEVTASGADTILIDGKPVLASSRLAVECRGKKIETIESLQKGDTLDKVVNKFVELDALQCGFCTPGFVMATRAFIEKHPQATEEEIKIGLGGNICRCGTYHAVMQSVLALVKK